MRTRTLGNETTGHHHVGAIGLGLMTMSQDGEYPREQLLSTMRAALDAGVTLFDTADAYGSGDDGIAARGQNEELVASLLDELGVRDQVLLATKGGHIRTNDGGWDVDSSPEHLHFAVEASLERLGVEQIALWQHHRPDPKVPFEEVVGTIGEIVRSGRVGMVGLSNVDPDQIRAAHAELGDSLVSVQNQFSPKFRTSAQEIDLCHQLGLAFLAWSPLGGLADAKELATKHPAFAEVAEARGISPQQVALAWELAQAPVVIPIPGAKRPESVTDSAAAADIDLTVEELASLNAS
ncbi:MAG TPA: aldo/keto reductase [Ornithinimicrobium sp.]|uniref:aldo/keto reductase n=1 Tax=Ornithinimicrobium sp. TaxID=1977084 RepID=UPI002B459A31|nr:aldo/keto reductase [Ornithinimicrobium sp.]HKJ11632.1 aldo/keto reductase [Ornithinimicrobium sp.]